MGLVLGTFGQPVVQRRNLEHFQARRGHRHPSNDRPRFLRASQPVVGIVFLGGHPLSQNPLASAKPTLRTVKDRFVPAGEHVAMREVIYPGVATRMAKRSTSRSVWQRCLGPPWTA